VEIFKRAHEKKDPTPKGIGVQCISARGEKERRVRKRGGLSTPLRPGHQQKALKNCLRRHKRGGFPVTFKGAF